MGGKGSGFASMDPLRHIEVSKKGAKAAIKKGVGHKFKKGEEAREAGRKGGLTHKRKEDEAVDEVSDKPPEDLPPAA